jgi:hypothetical protein
MKTKLEIFCAYLPYEVSVFFDWMQISIIKELSGNNLSAIIADEGKKLMLRPLSLLQTPMVHPVTAEEIENPLEWILSKAGIGSKYYVEFVQQILTNPNTRLQSSYFDVAELRQIDALALSLHFDIYGAIEKGFAIEYGAAQ